LDNPAEGLFAETLVTATGSHARFIWPDLPVEVSVKLGGLIGTLHNRRPELTLKPVERNSPEWDAVFHGWREDLESAAAIEKAFSRHFPNRVMWVESEKDVRGRIVAQCRIEGLGKKTPPSPETPPSLRAAWRPELGVVSLELFWKDSVARPPQNISEDDLRAFQSSIDAILQWAERRIRPVLNALRERLKSLYGERFRGLYVFGSYARPDAGIQLPENSDLDVALILSEFNNAYEEIKRFGDITYDLSLEHGLVISLVPIREADYCEGRTNFARVISSYAIPVK